MLKEPIPGNTEQKTQENSSTFSRISSAVLHIVLYVLSKIAVPNFFVTSLHVFLI